MLEETRLGVDEALSAITAVREKATEEERPLAVAVVDKSGELISALRMDGLAPRFLNGAIRKAYTAAIFERDTTALRQWWQDVESSQLDWNDPMISTLAGGLVVVSGKNVVGGIGVSGGTQAKAPGGPIRDVDAAEVGLNAMGLSLTHREGSS